MSRTCETFPVISNTETGPDVMEITIHAPAIAASARPGQFCMIETSGCRTHDPLLKRPLSIHRVIEDRIVFLYKKIGKGTRLLAARKPGDHMEITGPLGNWFSVSGHKCRILVGGGMGIAPLMFLSEALADKSGVTILVAGGRTRDELPARLDEMPGSDIIIVTEDGSGGEKGLVTHALERILDKNRFDRKQTMIAACGPWPMMKAVHDMAAEHNLPLQVSLEAYMACGAGLCLGCAVPDNTGGYIHVCREGPVVDSRKVRWLRGK